jgi:phosphoenolpyruvate carboxykinase (ATP)
MISAALSGDLAKAGFEKHEIFGLAMPAACPNVPDEILSPRNTWNDKDAYDAKANHLAVSFSKNFQQFENKASEVLLSAAPKVLEMN